MYGAINHNGSSHYYNGNVKCYSPSDHSKICHSNTDYPSTRENENIQQDKLRKHREDGNVEKRPRKKPNTDKKKYNRESREESFCMMANQEGVEIKGKKLNTDKRKEFSELNYYDIQCAMNDCNKDRTTPMNIRSGKLSESKKHQRSQSIDQIPTKDVASEHRILRRSDRPSSAERRELTRIERKGEYSMESYLPDIPNNQFQLYEQQEQTFVTPIKLIPNQHSSKHKDKSKKKKKKSRDVEIPEFDTLQQINKRMMNVKNEKPHTIHYRLETENNTCLQQQRTFCGDYNEQQFQHNSDLHEQNYFKTNQNDHRKIMKKELDTTNTKERKKEHRKKKTDKEYKALKRYMKKLAREQQNETFHLTTRDNVEPTEQIEDERVLRDRKFLENNFLNLDLGFNQKHTLKNTDSAKGNKHARKDYIPLELDELQISPKTHRKKHEHKKKWDNKRTMKTESSERMRSTSLSMKKMHKNLNQIMKGKGDQMPEGKVRALNTKSETSIYSKISNENMVCIYRNKDEKEDTNRIKFTKKHESIDTHKRYNRKEEKRRGIKEREHDTQIKMQERSSFLQEAMSTDFTTRSRPRLSRSRSNRYLAKLEDAENIDERPTKEVNCNDVGTSTILDNGFGDVLELPKGEPSKKRSVFHEKKKKSGEDQLKPLDKTLGIVEPPMKTSRFKLPSEKNKINSLESKMLSVVTIAPNKFNNDLEQMPTKAQSTPQMQHNTKIEKRNSDKRLERLLKYYKVEAQSKILKETESSQKSMKALIADKLSDYLKKLQQEDDEDILQFHTDDQKVVNFVLPIDLSGLECTEVQKQNDGMFVEIPKESFSDIYINYTADNVDEDYDDFNTIELSKVENKTDSPDLKSNGQKSSIFTNGCIFNQMESSSCEVMEENQQYGSYFSTKHAVQQSLLKNNTNTLYGGTGNHPSSEKSPNLKGAEESWNHNSRMQQLLLRNKENKNGVLKNCPNTNESEISKMDSAKKSYTAVSRTNTVEQKSPGIRKSAKVKIFQERKEPTKTYKEMSACNYEQVASNNAYFGQIQSNAESSPENIEKGKHNSSLKPAPKQQKDNFPEERKIGQTVDAIYAGNSDTHENMKIEKVIYSEPQNKPVETSAPTRGYEYFEIPPPRSKPLKTTRCDPEKSPNIKDKFFSLEQQENLCPKVEQRPIKNSQIPKRIPTNTTKNIENLEDFCLRPKPDENKTEESNLVKNCENNNYKPFFTPAGTSAWKYPKGEREVDNSLEKCLHWNLGNSQTAVPSEFNESAQNRTSETEKSTIVPRKSRIPVTRKDQSRLQEHQARFCVGNENNTSMFLTKSYKVPTGESSFEKRKMYDTRIRKNAKRRSLSESSGTTKMLPLIYEVRYCKVDDQCIPQVFHLEGTRSDQNLSVLCKDFDLEKSIESLTSVPSCYLAESKYGKDGVDLSTEPSCLLKESEYGHSTKEEPICLSTEPSCLLKESKFDISPTEKSPSVKQITSKNKFNQEDSNSSKSGRIKELIRENLLYSNCPITNRKGKSAIKIKKRAKKLEKEKLLTKTKNTFRCSKKTPRLKRKQLETVAKLNETPNDEDVDSSRNQDDSPKCQNLTKLTIDKVTENELCISFEEQKSPYVENESVLDEKSAVNASVESEFSRDKESSFSSKSTLINSKISPSVTSEESKETVIDVFVTSPGDSGYLTKVSESPNTAKVEKVCCSNEANRFSSTPTTENNSGTPRCTQGIEEKISKWNQKDLFKLRVQLLFPYVYDDFELLESARNTDLIKYYVESDNTKLKDAIDCISQKGDMRIKSRSVISLPSVKMIPEEPSINGDAEDSGKGREGGYFNYQKFIAQNNGNHSRNTLLKLNKPGVVGDCPDEKECLEIQSVNSSVKTSVTVKKSVMELFKLRPSISKRSNNSMLSDSDTLVEESISMKNNISDEEFLNNFHQIMAMECQKYAKKVVDRSKSNEIVKDELEYEEIPLECLLRNKSMNFESRDDPLEEEVELASDGLCNDNIDSIDSTKRGSIESVTCIKPSHSKWQTLPKKKSTESNSGFSLDFYPQETVSILDMIHTVQASSISEDSLIGFSEDKVLSDISSGEVTKQSEKEFFDNLLGFYDKESEYIKKLIRDDEFFSSLIENIRYSVDTTQILSHKDAQKKMKKQKKRGILRRFFRWKEKKSTETLFEYQSIGKSLEFAKSISNENSSITRESCYSFYKDFEDLEKDINEAKNPKSEHLQQLAYKAKCHLEPMVQATISNRHINDKIKLAGFLKMLDMVAKGDFTFFNNGDNRTLEEKLREHVAEMFKKVYRIANHEVLERNKILDHEKIQLLKMLVTKYHMGIETHINILAIYIGRCLIVSRSQLEDAIIYLMSQDSEEVNLEQLEKTAGLHRVKFERNI